MRAGTTRGVRGAPLVVLALVLGAWVSGRAMMWENPFPVAFQELVPGIDIASIDGKNGGEGPDLASGSPFDQTADPMNLLFPRNSQSQQCSRAFSSLSGCSSPSNEGQRRFRLRSRRGINCSWRPPSMSIGWPPIHTQRGHPDRQPHGNGKHPHSACQPNHHRKVQTVGRSMPLPSTVPDLAPIPSRRGECRFTARARSRLICSIGLAMQVLMTRECLCGPIAHSYPMESRRLPVASLRDRWARFRFVHLPRSG